MLHSSIANVRAFALRRYAVAFQSCTPSRAMTFFSHRDQAQFSSVLAILNNTHCSVQDFRCFLSGLLSSLGLHIVMHACHICSRAIYLTTVVNFDPGGSLNRSTRTDDLP